MEDLKTLPLFKSNYSIGRSILSLDLEQENESEADSIIKICKDNKFSVLNLVDDCISGLVEAYKNCQKEGLKLNFGLRLSFVPDLNIKDESSLNRECKYVIFARNTDGYNQLMKYWSLAAKAGFYYQPRLDFNSMRDSWNNKNLILAAPYYDSFIHNNTFNLGQCSNDFEVLKTNPIFLTEDNNLPFEPLLTEKVERYAKSSGSEILKVRSIYYKHKVDYEAYLINRCIHNRSNINKPDLENMSSDTFCFEEWQNDNLC